jgi:hypothetical protein
MPAAAARLRYIRKPESWPSAKRSSCGETIEIDTYRRHSRTPHSGFSSRFPVGIKFRITAKSTKDVVHKRFIRGLCFGNLFVRTVTQVAPKKVVYELQQRPQSAKLGPLTFGIGSQYGFVTACSTRELNPAEQKFSATAAALARVLTGGGPCEPPAVTLVSVICWGLWPLLPPGPSWRPFRLSGHRG